MLIRVRYTNNQYDMVSPHALDFLIQKGRIQSFCRHDGWIEPDPEKIRGKSVSEYSGPERRRHLES